MIKRQVYHIIKKYNIRIGLFSIDKSGFINVTGDVYITNTVLKKLPLRFKKVSGNFYCSSNMLVTLKGCPDFVGGIFNCYGNQLKSLEFGPICVGADYFCNENKLESLRGAPKIISGNFNCFINQLQTLEHGPEIVSGNYYANNNLLINLLGAPKQVKSFFITSNFIKNLENCPERINILAIDNTVELVFGQQNCHVNKVEIEIKENFTKSAISLDVIDQCKFLPILFKYGKYMSLYKSEPDSESKEFDMNLFNDFLLDVKEGLR
ncbi:hypothetical protein HNP37_004462 [Flavobacterium nitrogenifigens]|uniref:Uncharacterized protein n=2 Tax=Flavobacterium TaxID=237 RepID=A0A7W7J2H1_9FLAO|nr:MULTISPECIES: hypothetical protein [Flavobacterium]MBB4804375.1 hypothetical protein [Flavobacterium nitrogenifigens]MBB6389229.1 hypothetical protein [Flavobacterium notoginsengisoli]